MPHRLLLRPWRTDPPYVRFLAQGEVTRVHLLGWYLAELGIPLHYIRYPDSAGIFATLHEGEYHRFAVAVSDFGVKYQTITTVVDPNKHAHIQVFSLQLISVVPPQPKTLGKQTLKEGVRWFRVVDDGSAAKWLRERTDIWVAQLANVTAVYCKLHIRDASMFRRRGYDCQAVPGVPHEAQYYQKEGRAEDGAKEACQ